MQKHRCGRIGNHGEGGREGREGGREGGEGGREGGRERGVGAD